MSDLVPQKLAAIVASLAILGVAYLVRRIAQSWTHPAVLFAVFWFFMTFVPLVAVHEVPINAMSIVFIALAVVAFAAPAMFQRTKWPKAVATAKDHRRHSAPPTSKWIIAGIFSMQALTLIFVLINLQLQGFAISEFLANPINAANRYLKARYDGLITPNLFSQAGIVLNYIAAGTAGLIAVRSKSILFQAMVLVATFLPSLVYMQIYADKGTLFLAAAYFFGSVIVSRVSLGDIRLVTKNTTISLAMALAVLIPALVVTMMARNGSASGPTEGVGKIVFYLRSYAFGHLYAFSDWFSHYMHGISAMDYADPDARTWGYWTFMAIGEVIRPDYVLPDGYYSEYFAYPGELQTNIYTIFRGMIYDFDWYGSLAFMLLLGWISSTAYLRMLIKPFPIISQSFFVFLTGFLYTTFIFSLFTWTSVFAAAIGVAGVFAVDRALLQKHAPEPSNG